jgi:hypothetical protein
VADRSSHHHGSPFGLWATGIGVCGLAGGGFTLSFSALNDLAVASGIDRHLAFLWPLIVDGFIIVATAAALTLRSRGPRVTWYPWVALVLFSAISVIGNSIHAADAARLGVPMPIATGVSSVPAIALLVATHLLVVIVGSRRGLGDEIPREISASQPAAAAERSIGLVPSTASAHAAPDVVAHLRERRAAGSAITGSVIAELEGVSARTGSTERRIVPFGGHAATASDSVDRGVVYWGGAS